MTEEKKYKPISELKSYGDLSGDGGSHIIGQVGDIKKQIARNLSGVGQMIAVGSAKGGVGKSTLTMQLGASLNQLGYQVALLDADLNGPSLARLSGLKDTPPFPGENGLLVPKNEDGLGVVSLGSVVPENESVDFDSVAPGDSYTWRATKEFTTLADILGHTDWGTLDFLLIDLPPGAERGFQFAQFLGETTAHLLVSVPSDVALGVVTRGIAALKKTSSPILGYIENMSGYYCKDCDEIKPLFSSSDNIKPEVPLLGKIPFDPALAQMCDQGKSIQTNPDSPATKAIQAAAKTLVELLKK